MINYHLTLYQHIYLYIEVRKIIINECYKLLFYFYFFLISNWKVKKKTYEFINIYKKKLSFQKWR